MKNLLKWLAVLLAFICIFATFYLANHVVANTQDTTHDAIYQVA